jgi:hypothetical protein
LATTEKGKNPDFGGDIIKTSRRRFNHLLGLTPVIHWASDLWPNKPSTTLSSGVSGLVSRADVENRYRPATQARWYERLVPGVHLDYHYPEWDDYILSKANPREDIKKVVDSGAELVVVFAKCMYGHAYYNTKVGHKHKNLANRDFLEEWVTEARKHKLVVLAYYIMHEDLWAGVHHPEWTMKEPDGKIVPGRLGTDYMCYNSGYRDYVKAQLAEIMEYDIDGFHFDMLWFGRTGTVCYCPENCRPLFRKTYGIEMPEKPSWDGAWRNFLEFRYESSGRFCDEVRQLIRNKRPELSIMYNYHAQPPNDWREAMKPVRHRLISDYGTGEGYPPQHGHSYASLFSSFLSGTAPGAPWQGVTSRYTRGINDHTTRPVADMKWETFTFLAHGGMPLFVDTPEDDGTLDGRTYERVSAVFKEVKQKIDCFGLEPLPEVGLYFSLKSRDWYAKGDTSLYLQAYMGAHKALVESHIQAGTIFDENVSLKRLQQFPVIYLANTAILEQEEMALLRRYVEEGGRLLGTFEASRFDLNGAERNDFALADVFGVHYRGKTEFKGNYFAIAEEFLNPGTEPGGNNFIPGPSNVVSLADGRGYGELKIAFHDRTPETRIGHAAHNAAWKVVGPAVISNQFGKGKVAYLPFAPGYAYLGDFPLPEHRLLIRNVIRHLNPNPPITISAPLNVESVVRQDVRNHRYIIHLIAFMGVRDAVAPGAGGILVPPIEEGWRYTAHVSFRDDIRSIKALNPKTRLTTKGNTVELETGDIHEALIIQC